MPWTSTNWNRWRAEMIKTRNRVEEIFTEAIGPDGKGDLREALKVVEALRADGLTQMELAAYRSVLFRTRHQWDVGARARMDVELLGKTKEREIAVADGGSGLVDDPLVMPADADLLEYRGPGDWQLFVDGPSADDVRQGRVGDCYFVAALASVAELTPEVIWNAFIVVPEDLSTLPPEYAEQLEGVPPGALAVRFFRKVNGKPTEVLIPVDGDLPRKPDGSLQYAKQSDLMELWVPIIEKAFADFEDLYGSDPNIGYEGIAGGSGSYALEVLTGGAVTTRSMSTKAGSGNNRTLANPDRVFEAIQQATEADKYVVASTYSEEERAANDKRAKKIAEENVERAEKGLDPLRVHDPAYPDSSHYKNQNIYNNHVYTVFGAVERTDANGVTQRFIQMRNPWGSGEPSGNGPNDGYFEIPLELYLVLFREHSVVEHNPEPPKTVSQLDGFRFVG